jgi:DNA invertase Pin-like site-specific DNA recombinase
VGCRIRPRPEGEQKLVKRITMTIYGYARVNSSDQSTDTLVRQLRAAGCQVVHTDKMSGKSHEGGDPLAAVLKLIGPGDGLVCVKFDTLGRSTRDVLNLVHELDKKGAFLRILEPAILTDGPMGKMVLTVLGMVAEMELGFIKVRQREGIERAKSKGDVYKGRKPTIDRSAVLNLFHQGIGASEIARRLKIARASVYRVLELAGR